ncbi:MAG: hypothetical protein LBI43_05615 [Streptococcaceae bacterium]|jgi:hypothetical protein|nr:hypothetical protein [Streptococcaceae bacterium]
MGKYQLDAKGRAANLKYHEKRSNTAEDIKTRIARLRETAKSKDNHGRKA